MSSKVYLIGAGPGAVDLITLRGAQLLAQADVVLYDALVSKPILALAPNAQLIAVGKRCAGKSMPQAQINQAIVRAALSHHCVVRLKGGDPSLFGRLEEEIAALKAAQIEFEIIPGVTTASAAAAALGRSLTTRGKARSVVFTTPRIQSKSSATQFQDPLDLEALGRPDCTVAVYMGGQHASTVAQHWLAQGVLPETPVTIAKAVSTPQQQLTPSTVGLLALGSFSKDSRPVLILRDACRTENGAEEARKQKQSAKMLSTAQVLQHQKDRHE
jgi:uroporphyrin-III C-methyltransferase